MKITAADPYDVRFPTSRELAEAATAQQGGDPRGAAELFAEAFGSGRVRR